MAECSNFSMNNSAIRRFMATINIAPGFKVDQANYQTYLSIDKSNIAFVVEEEIYPSVVTIPNLNADEVPGAPETVEFECQSRVRALKFRGPLFINAIVSQFDPESFLQNDATDPQMTYTAPTAFTSSNVIDINDTVAYACYECDLPEGMQQYWQVTVEQGQEFVIDHLGNMYRHFDEGEGDNTQFFEALSDTENNQTLHIPYTLKVQYVEPIVTEDPVTPQ